MQAVRFAKALEQARSGGCVLLDLTEADPGRCGLGWSESELNALLNERGQVPAATLAQDAREATANYLAGHGGAVSPDHIVLVRSTHEALRTLLAFFCEENGEVLVPVPDRHSSEPNLPAHARPYGLVFEGRWRLDQRSIRQALSRHTRAILVGNPADPTGAGLSGEELEFLRNACGSRGLTLLGDESSLDVTLESSTSVVTMGGCQAIHCSGLGSVCGLRDAQTSWLAVTGPDATSLAARLSALLSSQGFEPGRDLALVPPLLGRRETYLTRLRARISRNRSALASGSLREAPWALQWGGGCWAVLQVNPAQDEEELCFALLAEGLAVLPGLLSGFPRAGYLVVSLLPAPDLFDMALHQLQIHLRRQLSNSAWI